MNPYKPFIVKTAYPKGSPVLEAFETGFALLARITDDDGIAIIIEPLNVRFIPHGRAHRLVEPRK